MSIALVVTRGYGNGTLTGDVNLVVTRGYSAGVAPTTAAVTGGFTETQIQAGGQQILIELTNDTWVAAGATFNAQRQNIIDGLDSAQSELLGWNNEVRDKEVVGAVVRTSDTLVTITLTAAASYNITANETITVTVPATALVTSSIDVVGTPTFAVTPTVVVPTGGPTGGAAYPRVPHRWPEKQKRKKRIYEKIEAQLEELEDAPAEVKREVVEILKPITDARRFSDLEERVETAIIEAKGNNEIRAIERKIRQLDDLIDEREIELLIL